jgi:hypothetical protein
MSDDTLAVLGALHVDEGKLKGHVDEVVRSSVEETLNGRWMRRRITSAGHSDTSGPRIGWMAGPDTTSASSRPRPAR